MPSLDPEDFVQGGLFNDADIIIKSARFAMWDYNGSIATPVPAIKFEMEDKHSGDVVTQYWSIGASKDWTPNEDGTELVQVGSATSLTKNSNGFMLLTSIRNAGFPKDKLQAANGKINVFDNMECHVVRMAAPKREGLDQSEQKKAKKYDDTVLVVDRIDRLPWEKPKAGGGAAKAGGTKPGGTSQTATTAAPDTGDADIAGIASNTVLELIMEAGGSVSKKGLAVNVFKKLASQPQAVKTQVTAMVAKEEFLSSNALWTYENETLTVA